MSLLDTLPKELENIVIDDKNKMEQFVKEHTFKFAPECPYDVLEMVKILDKEGIEYSITYSGYKDLEKDTIKTITTDKEKISDCYYGLVVILYVESLTLDELLDLTIPQLHDDVHRIIETIDYKYVYDEKRKRTYNSWMGCIMDNSFINELCYA